MTSNDLHICLLPLHIKWGDKDQNLKSVEEMLAQVHPQTDLVILPETFSTGFPAGLDKETVREMAERNTGHTIDFVKEMAAKYHFAICGSYVADSGGSLYNRAFFIEPSGDEMFEDKRHLFTMAGEGKVFSRGYDRMAVRYRGWNLAMVVCYDVRFPVWCRNVNNEYDALIAVANWPAVRVDAWNKLLPARAIENEAYVCAVNCCGTDTGGYEYDGSSFVLDFKGKDVSVRLEDSTLVYGTLSRERLDMFRAKFPAWGDADPFKLL
ncbi:MAG: nitrilase family protein [Candidatus Amulumruptor caecigallinarius]|nr:nitrilase family protein [Candidatus Amulumruptor caecigallinarius]